MGGVEQYRGNESDERADKLFDYVDAQSEARINAITTNMQLYGEPLQKNITSKEGAIAELFKYNKKSKDILEKFFPGMAERGNTIGIDGKLPEMNANWNEQVMAKNDSFDKPFIRGTADITVKEVDTPNDIDNNPNQVEQLS